MEPAHSNPSTDPSAGRPTAEPRQLTGSEILWDALVNLGVDVVFGYPGGAIMPAYDAMIKYPIHHVLVRHEQGAAHMADGYARVSGRVGVCVATSGPGATNLITGIATAMMDSTPMVAITGQVPSGLIGSDAFQETDITGVALPVTKHSFLVTRPEDIAQALKEAFYIANSGRKGPVLVDITKDAQQKSCLYSFDASPVKLPGYRPEPELVPGSIQQAAAMIAAAKQPVLFCGHGVIQGNATEELLALIDKTKIPVAATLLGLGGFPATHPHALGMMGMHGEAWVNQAIQESDLLIAVGMRFDDRVTGNLKTYAPNAKKIHIELDTAEINKNVRVDLPLVGDCKAILRQLLPAVKAPSIEAWLAHIGDMKGESAVIDIQELPDNGKLYAAHVIHDLWKLTDGKAIVVTDVGQHQMWEAQYYKHDFPRRLVTSGGLGTMGFALPAGIGAKFGKKDAEVWVIAGDGGVQMTAAELTTIAQEGIKVNLAIINNGYLGMVRQWQQFFYGGRYVATPMKSPDFVKLADAHGLLGLRATTRAEVNEAVKRARAHDGAVVIDFRVEQEDSVYPMVPAGADLHDMIRRPKREATEHNPIYETGEDK
ncbi:MAG TPA: biosynthetic-type acetolactate synthase large subunit [Polyangiaceae bacterium]|nr:biosynthetic-type acetolactate synthase large subunit [Polyangiaceae bacterium]